MVEIKDIKNIDILWGLNIDVYDDNVDVTVKLYDGRKFFAQVFTIANIIKLMNKYRVTGESNSGSYFWACDMFIVTHLTQEIITNTIHDLIKKGRFEDVFCFIGSK